MTQGLAGRVATEFGDRLARLRQERGLSQAELAKRVGVHPSQIHRYEVGGAEPTLGVLRALALALQVSSDALVFSDDIEVRVEPRLRRAVENAHYMSEHTQAVIAEVIEAFVHRHAAEARPRRRGPSRAASSGQ